MKSENKVAIITGAARGIGEAIAIKLGEAGYRVVGIDLLEGGNFFTTDNSLRHSFFICDVSNEKEVSKVVKEIDRKYGRIDVLVNVAGVVLVKPLIEVTWEEFEHVVNVNLGGTFLLCKYVLPIMEKKNKGSIVNMASVSGHVGQIDHVLYGSTKGGILAFTRALAWEVASHNIRVNSISPGSVDTEMLRGDVKLESERNNIPYEEVKAKREAEQAFGRWADPSEIAEAVVFLASDKSSFITGTDLLVDCGWVAK